MAKAQLTPDSPDAEAVSDTAPDRPNAVTRAMDHSRSPCCAAPTTLETLSDALPGFDAQLRARVRRTDPTGDELVAVCPNCGNGVGLICE